MFSFYTLYNLGFNVICSCMHVPVEFSGVTTTNHTVPLTASYHIVYIIWVLQTIITYFETQTDSRFPSIWSYIHCSIRERRQQLEQNCRKFSPENTLNQCTNTLSHAYAHFWCSDIGYFLLQYACNHSSNYAQDGIVYQCGDTFTMCTDCCAAFSKCPFHIWAQRQTYVTAPPGCYPSPYRAPPKPLPYTTFFPAKKHEH